MADSDAIDREEFAAIFRREGIVIPPDRRDAVFRGYVDMKARIARLHAIASDEEPFLTFRPYEGSDLEP